MAKILDKLYNRVIEGEILEISDAEVQNLGLAKASQLPELSDAINLGALHVFLDEEGDTPDYRAYYDKEVTEAEYNAIKDSGLIILMFNSTTVMIPYAKAQANRFVVNAVYDADGNSMVARASLTFGDDSIYTIHIAFDANFAEAIFDSEVRPYAIVKFLNI